MAEGHRLVLIGRRGGGAAFTGFTATSSALDTCIIAPAEADRGVRIHFDANKQSQQQNQQNKKQSHALKIKLQFFFITLPPPPPQPLKKKFDQ